MVKKTYTYTDYNGNNRTEDFYFNLTETEIIKLEAGEEGGLSEKIKRISSEKNVAGIIDVFDKIVAAAYGEKSEDGKRLIKSPELSKAFMETEAYNLLFLDFVQKEGFATEFFNLLVPAKKTEA